MSSIREKQQVEQLVETVAQQQQTLNLLTATVRTLQAEFPQFGDMLSRLNERTKKLEADAPQYAGRPKATMGRKKTAS